VPFLKENQLLHYLCNIDLLSKKDIVFGDLHIVSNHSKNINYMVHGGERNNYFIKQIDSNNNDEEKFLLKKEGTIFWLMTNEKPFQQLQGILPKYYLYDDVNSILISEYLETFKDLNYFHRTQKRYPLELGSDIAKAFVKIHSINKNNVSEESYNLFPKIIPWIFSVGIKETNQLHLSHEMAYEVVRVIKKSAYPRYMSKFTKEWTSNTLIHGDIKWANILISERIIKIIDWEISDFGEPLWDVSGLFQSYLAHWIMFNNHHTADSNRYFESFMPILQSFWKSYCAVSYPDAVSQNNALLKTIQYAAIRLVQTCIEFSRFDKHVMDEKLQTLQFGENILVNPQSAANEIFQIRHY
jgi:thiamine kinase-like enzyme